MSNASNRPVDRMPFLCECANYAKEQIVFHSNHRDHWLIYQLLVQAGLLALASGIRLGEFLQAETELPDMLILSIPISFVFAALYIFEDRLVSQFCGYIFALSKQEKNISDSRLAIETAEGYLKRSKYTSRVLPVRFAAQILTFTLIPLVLTYYGVQSVKIWEPIHTVILVGWSMFWLATVVLLIIAFIGHARFDKCDQDGEGC
ncbi:MAG: hypothetical protein GF310_11620 [candidate division Zixibacteria bacterium]|nr:hypothetical protein [candidate division Zixibacteria bacterium]